MQATRRTAAPPRAQTFGSAEKPQNPHAIRPILITKQVRAVLSSALDRLALVATLSASGADDGDAAAALLAASCGRGGGAGDDDDGGEEGSSGGGGGGDVARLVTEQQRLEARFEALMAEQQELRRQPNRARVQENEVRRLAAAAAAGGRALVYIDLTHARTHTHPFLTTLCWRRWHAHTPIHPSNSTPLPHTHKYTRAQAHIVVATAELRDATERLCRSLKENLNARGDRARAARLRAAAAALLARTLEALRPRAGGAGEGGGGGGAACSVLPMAEAVIAFDQDEVRRQ